MFGHYYYNATATQANMVADLVAILTGETNPANLSSDCDTVNTTITATVAAGWTLHDSAAGSNGQVVKAAHTDSGTQFKYLLLAPYSSTGIALTGYETWNATSHTGTNANPTSASSVYIYISTSVAGFITIASSARFAAFQGNYDTTQGDGNYKGISMIAEYSRECPWNVADTYPSFAVISTGDCINGTDKVYPIRAKNTSDSDVTGSSATGNIATIGAESTNINSSSYFPIGADKKVYDNSSNLYTPFFPIYLMDTAKYSAPLGEISTICDIWMPPGDLLGNFETVTKGANTYIAVRSHSSNNQKFLFRNG